MNTLRSLGLRSLGLRSLGLRSLGLRSLRTCALPVALMLVTACAGSASSDTTPGASVSHAPIVPAEAASLSGTWAFALASSEVAAPLQERCAQESGRDAARSQACWDEVRLEAAREKIRFTKDDAGRTVWSSFESDGTNESLYVEVPVELAPDGPGHVLAKIAGAPRGPHAARFASASASASASVRAMRVELVDARTIALTDPKKGRLVYTKE